MEKSFLESDWVASVCVLRKNLRIRKALFPDSNWVAPPPKRQRTLMDDGIIQKVCTT